MHMGQGKCGWTTGQGQGKCSGIRVRPETSSGLRKRLRTNDGVRARPGTAARAGVRIRLGTDDGVKARPGAGGRPKRREEKDRKLKHEKRKLTGRFVVCYQMFK